MGTAVRSGTNRAIEAAQAAMASPLLEDGAIDGARGILINISGSSSLKLSEVNEASTLIQNSAHEDANIIFGAVLDESMGDEVKITVIATGFRQEMPERRERMLSAALREPIAPQVSARPAAARFASEEEEPIFASAASHREPLSRRETHRESDTEEPIFESAPAVAVPESFPEQAVFSIAVEETVAVAVAEAEPQPAAFEETHQDENGESLDIPAFLRRGGL
jgi:cell division protein FtsZ